MYFLKDIKVQAILFTIFLTIMSNLIVIERIHIDAFIVIFGFLLFAYLEMRNDKRNNIR